MPRRQVLTAMMVALAALSAATPAAFGDGDPASDVLANQNLFLPLDATASPYQQAQLASLLNQAAHTGRPIRLALIASPADLGSVTALWRQPQEYARFLGQELSLAYHGQLLVVMPNGIGLYEPGTPSALPPTLVGLRAARGSAGLMTVAIVAIQRVVAASGHPLKTPNVTPAISLPGSSKMAPWIVFAVGSMLIAAAWIASLHARPPRIRQRARS